MLTRRDFAKLLSTWAAALSSGSALATGEPSLSPPNHEAESPLPATSSQASSTTNVMVQDMDPWRTRTPTSVEESDRSEVWERTRQTGLKYDLLIKGGTIIDPDQHLHAVLDVAVKNGKISRVARDISPDPASRVVNAKGKIVTPGFI